MTEILIIEDDDVVREASTLALERYGHTVRSAGDGLAGLDAFRAQTPDIVLLDVMLPLLDGFSVCRAIRAESDVPIIMLTARDDGVDIVQGLEAGADDYITKPVRPKVFVSKVKALLKRKVAGHSDDMVLEANGIRVDMEKVLVYIGDREVQL
ncbi:MAG TPA: response regulator transcription factor, partial [Phycicoccus sp.]|nr:response regulator transcription factor [Phycicoccus sp.]